MHRNLLTPLTGSESCSSSEQVIERKHFYVQCDHLHHFRYHLGCNTIRSNTNGFIHSSSAVICSYSMKYITGIGICSLSTHVILHVVLIKQSLLNKCLLCELPVGLCQRQHYCTVTILLAPKLSCGLAIFSSFPKHRDLGMRPIQ